MICKEDSPWWALCYSLLRSVRRHAFRFNSPPFVKHCKNMTKTITKIGNSHGIILDSTLLQLARMKPGDEVNVEVHPGGTITIAPLNPQEISASAATDAAARLIANNSELFKRLS